MGAALKKRVLKLPATTKADRIAAEAATIFVQAAADRRRAEKEYSDAKVVLKKWLGDLPSRGLPDGRRVTRSLQEFEAITIERPGYTQETIKVVAPESAE